MPKALPLWLYRRPDQRQLLQTPAQPVSFEAYSEPALTKLFEQMTVTMYKANGIGLAAPQIGHSLQLAVIAAEVTADHQPLILINPVINNASQETDVVEEGCLSIPEVYGLVARPIRVQVTYFDVRGQPHTVQAEQLHARVIQHEIDHLQGRLFIDRATSITKGKEKL